MGFKNRFKKMLGLTENSDEEFQKNNTDIIKTDSNQENIESQETFENDDAEKNFRYLDDLIHSGAAEIILESDITYAEGEYSYFKDGIRVDVDNIIIDGNGHTIDADKRVRIFNIAAKGVKLKNITFKKGHSTENGGAIYINEDSSLDICECMFCQNSAKTGGGAIHNDGDELNISKSSFEKNISKNVLHFGGSAILSERGSTSIFKCSFIKNIVENRGATIYANECKLRISESVFTKNVISESGGVISGRENKIRIDDSTFDENIVTNGGIVSTSYASTFTVSRCAFTQNMMEESGAVLNADEGEMSVYDSTISHNTLNGCSVAYTFWGNLKILNCEITDNSTSKNLIHNEAFMEILGTDFLSNTAKNLIFNAKESTLGIFSCRFQDNAAGNSVIFSKGESCTIERGILENSLAREDAKNIINHGKMTLINPDIREKSKTILNNKHILLKKASPDLLSKISGKGKVESDDVEIPDGEKFDFGYLDGMIRKSDGDEIVLENDISLERYEEDFYEGGIELDMDNLTIDGNGNSIKANGKSRIFIITADNITLKNIIFKNGHQFKNPNNPLNNNGGAIKINKCRKITIENCKFTGNVSGEYGGAIDSNGDLTIIKSEFDNNQSINGGCISNKSSLNMTESELSKNSARMGGAIYNTGEMSLLKTSLDKNTSQYGGAVYNNKVIEISQSVMCKNTSTYSGGGAIYNDKGEMTISKSELNRNSSPNYGGAIYNYEGILSISLSLMNENTTSNKNSQGGAIYSTRGKLTVRGCEFIKNTSKRYGGGISNSYGELTISDSSFIKNKSDIRGEAIYSYAQKVKHENCTFEDTGGAYYIYEMLD